MKVYLDLVLPTHKFPNYTRVTTKYNEYNENSDVEGSEVPYRATVQNFVGLRSESQPQSVVRTQGIVEDIPIIVVMSKISSRDDHCRTWVLGHILCYVVF